MGTRLPPNEAGNPCGICWGAGKEFGEGPTPTVITAQLYSLQPGEFWNPAHELLLLTPHLLIQGGQPCFWAVQDEFFTWQLQYFNFTTWVRIFLTIGVKQVFRDAIDPACQVSLPNGLAAAANNFAYDGHLLFSWNPEDL